MNEKITKKSLIPVIVELDYILMINIPNSENYFNELSEIYKNSMDVSGELKKFNEEILNSLNSNKNLKNIIEARNLLYSIIRSEFEDDYKLMRINKGIDLLIEQNEVIEDYLKPKANRRKSKKYKLYETELKKAPTDCLIQLKNALNDSYLRIQDVNKLYRRNKKEFYKDLLAYNDIERKRLFEIIQYEYFKNSGYKETIVSIENNFKNTISESKKLSDEYWNMLLKCFYIANEEKNMEVDSQEKLDNQEIDYKEYFKQQCLYMLIAERNKCFNKSISSDL